MSPTLKVDRAALVRRAVVELVAENGFRGTSMAAVADRAGVATGTAYVHYASKDDLVLAAYAEVKESLGKASLAAARSGPPPADVFRAIWHAVYDHLAADAVRARFLMQVEASPYAASAHEAAMESDQLLQEPKLEELMARLIDLPPTVLYDLALGPAVRLAASADTSLTAAELEALADACWRAVSRP